MSKSNSNGKVLFHFIFGIATGGIWWLWLFLKAITR